MQRLLRRQQADGAWRYPGGNPASTPGSNYAVLETYRSLGILVEMYGCNHSHPALQAAVEYLFSCRTAEGDIRGILGNQYMPYYHAAILELLIKAGYADDPRVVAGLEWLLALRQADSGWIVPLQAVPSSQRPPRHLVGAGRAAGPGATFLAPGDRHGAAGVCGASHPITATPLRGQPQPCSRAASSWPTSTTIVRNPRID